MVVDQSVLDSIALSREEYGLIVERLGRDPNELELEMFGALWSEHCGYKNSKPLLRILPSRGDRVLTQQGAENAGAIDIGDGLCVVMKIESHNHPSAIEPYQGAATGVGGIVRDIFAMGARPIAILDSLRFGPLHDARNRYLFTNVVSGISGYGNCLGVPTVAGEVYFEDSYSHNPLVNAMCVGLAPIDKLVSARAETPGSTLMLVGSDTGRDGIHGASGLASTTDPAKRFDELRPAVQVGNPFLEKLLMEACLDLAANHSDWIVGIQDLGAAGLTSSAAEAGAKAGNGVVIDVAKVTRRESGMTPYEVMLSESQERMLVIVKSGYEAQVAGLFQHWGLEATQIGHVTKGNEIRIYDGDVLAASLPLDVLTEPPLYTREGRPPEEMAKLQSFPLDSLPDVADANSALLRLLAAPNIASKRWIYRQYDHQLFTNTVIGPGADAALLRIKGTDKAIAVSTDGNGRFCYLDPYLGGAIAVAEAARNAICSGAKPVALTDCLNFGNPERPEVYYQMEQAVRGIAAASEKLGVPVISGNVSLYNETGSEAVYPTPVIGVLGLLEDLSRRCASSFQADGDVVLLLGDSIEATAEALAGSEYLKETHNLVAGHPRIDLDVEANGQKTCLEMIHADLLASCHDCADGGLAVALAECCIGADRGLDASTLAIGGRLDAALFGEAQSRFVVSCQPGRVDDLIAIARRNGVTLSQLGVIGGERLIIGQYVDILVAELANAYESGLPSALDALG